MFERLGAICCQCSFSWRQDPKGQCCFRNYEIACKSSYRYQIVDRSWHSSTGYKKDAETQAAIDTNIFNKVAKKNDQLCEERLAKPEIERKKKQPLKVFLSCSCNAKLRMLELYYNIFKIFCDTEKYGEMEIDNESL